MKTINLTLEVNDDFEPGDCFGCPLSYDKYYYDEDDGGGEWDTHCVLSCTYEDCPLKIITKKEKEVTKNNFNIQEEALLKLYKNNS